LTLDAETPGPDGALIRVVWREDGVLDATFVATAALTAPLDEIHLEPHRAQLYAYRDACDGGGTPSPDTALTEAQLRTVHLLRDRWDECVRVLASGYPSRIRRYLEWGSVTITWQEKEGHAYAKFRGSVGAPFPTKFDEHGIEATLLGLSFVATEEGDTESLVHDGAPLGFTRLGRDAPPELRAEWERARERRSRPRLAVPDDLPEARRAFLDRYFASPDLESALAELEAARGWVAVGAGVIPAAWFDHDLAWIRPLVAAGVVNLPRDCLHSALDVAHLRWWVALGAPIDGTAREGDAPHRTALARHTRDPALFEALVALGADPRHLFDASGRPYRPLSPELEAVLVRWQVPSTPSLPPPRLLDED
jgi:hypothetical protein